MTILNAEGEPVTASSYVECPRCGKGAVNRHVHTFFGGWWKRICECGYVYESGQGIPPVEE